MYDTQCLDTWDAAVAAYLSSRHAIGRAYRKEELILRELRSFLMRAAAADLDPALFERWRAQFYHLSSSTRVVREHTVYRFCRYRRRSDPGCFLPDRESLARQKPHALPTIIEPGQVAQLLAYMSQLPSGSRSPVRAQAMRLAVVLLYTAGLRRGELVRLTLGDVDECAGVLRIRESKFHKSRWVPLSVSAHAELLHYLAARQQARLDERPGAPLLCTRGSCAYTGAGFYSSLKHLLRCAGIHDSAGRCPRVQDFRHNSETGIIPRASSGIFNTSCYCSTCAGSSA
ncbi:MAG: tyrosine-type recombinase/integrase [Burkholderiaceae bacterium]|nr:tyrosine-type recombinase/integrase [Burkholderiaceae bacterium]